METDVDHHLFVRKMEVASHDHEQDVLAVFINRPVLLSFRR